MKKNVLVVICLLLVAALTVPGVALAKGGENQGRGKGVSKVTSSEADKSQSASSSKAEAKQAAKAAKREAKQAAKAEKRAAKEARKANKAAEKEARKQTRVAGAALASDEITGSTEPSGSLDASDSVEATVPAGPEGAGIANAMTRITANLEKSLAKMAEGKKKQLPPGLVKVWMKFASWLGVDPTTRPGYSAPVEEPTSTPEPTSTVEPTETVEPTPTVEPTLTVEPTSTVDPSASPTAP